MRKQIIEILTEICPGIDFENETALIDDGLIDSLDIVAVVTELMEADLRPLAMRENLCVSIRVPLLFRAAPAGRAVFR